MNKKFLMAAMALPMLFTACSEEELFEGVNNNMDTPQAKGFYMTLAPTLGEGTDSRALWDGAKLTWEDTDKISVYWLGSDQFGSDENNLKGEFNSIFKTKDGKSFTSESMVFEGGNIAVYPGNTSFYKQDDINLTVPLTQDDNTILETPYISNLLNVVDPEDYEDLERQIAGYNNGLYSPMKMAANVLYLNLELANTSNLAQYNFKVDSVSLVDCSAKGTPDATNKNAFGHSAKLKKSGTPFDQGKFAYKDGSDAGTEADTLYSITNAVRVATIGSSNTLTSKAITDNGNGKYLVKFVVLPTSNNAFTADAEIVIYTNCGRINLTTTKTAAAGTTSATTNEAIYTPTAAGATVVPVWAGLVSGAKDGDGNAVDQTIAQTLNAVTARQIASDDSNFAGEFIGKKFTRTVKADMANATLNDSHVFTSEDIKNYVSIYTAMNSTQPMNLILDAVEGSIFKSLTKDAIAAVNSKNTYAAPGVTEKINVTLSMDEGMDAVQIVGGGAVYFNENKQWKDNATQVKMVLEAGKSWTMNDNDNFDHVREIINNGTLTIAGNSKDNVQYTLNEKVINNGTINIGGNGILQVGTKLNNVSYKDKDVEITGVVNVATGQDLVFNENVTEDIAGKINVAQGGFMTIAKDINVVSNAEINNNGTVSSIAGNGGLTNAGVINVLRENGVITYVQNNAHGVINLKSRNNEVVVKSTNKGKIVYNYKSATDGVTFGYFATDKFNYVVFGEGNDEIKFVKVGTTINGIASQALDNISFEFTDETNLTATEVTNPIKVADVKVVNGATLSVYSGNYLDVHCLTNEGNITIGGIITWNNDFQNAGIVRSVGNGAIVQADKTVENTVIRDIQNSSVATPAKLSSDVKLTETLNFQSNNALDGQDYVVSVGKGSADFFTANTLRLSTTTGGADIKNVTIDGNNASYKVGNTTYGIRAIFLTNGGITNIDNVVIKNVTYCINDDASTKTLNVSNSTLEGWTSYNMNTTGTFNNVKFEVGPSQGTFRPHGDATLTNCTFEEGFEILTDKLEANNKTITFNNCYYGDKKIVSVSYNETDDKIEMTFE